MDTQSSGKKVATPVTISKEREGERVVCAWVFWGSKDHIWGICNFQKIDHAGYVRQAFGAASLTYFDDILHSNLLKDSEGPSAGWRSVLRTFISAFIVSYEIKLQSEDNNVKLIRNILGETYQGEIKEIGASDKNDFGIRRWKGLVPQIPKIFFSEFFDHRKASKSSVKVYCSLPVKVTVDRRKN
ncbi:hypothetical protein LXL04_035588 [Taraxacum kok-saghyz]